MAWDCMSRKGARRLEKIEGRITADFYIKVLEDHLFGTMEDLWFNVSDIDFQQDNDPQCTENLPQNGPRRVEEKR